MGIGKEDSEDNFLQYFNDTVIVVGSHNGIGIQSRRNYSIKKISRFLEEFG
jgi:hypothetical protein